MRSLIIKTLIYFLFASVLFYIPFSFAAKSFNPMAWDNYSGLRLIYALSIWGTILFSAVGTKVKAAEKYFQVQ